MLRTGKAYRNAIAADGRKVYIGGDEVTDVIRHPAFRGAVEHAAALYDMVIDNGETAAFAAPETGESVSKIWMQPKSREELADRRRVFRRH